MKKLLTRIRGRVRRYRPRAWLSRHWKPFVVEVGKAVWHLAAKRWWGVSVFKVVKAGLCAWQWPNATCYQEMCSVKKRKAQASQTDAQHLAAMESVVMGKLQPIVAHCAATKYDDGDARKPGWVTIKTLGSAWIVEAKDPDTCSKLTVVQSTLDDALALLSVLLESDEAPWESDPWLAQQAAKAKKK